MTINSLIKTTLLMRDEIISQHRIFSDYQRTNPWHIHQMVEELKNRRNIQNIPSFDYLISLKEDYLIDSYSKIYRQIIKRNPFFNDKNPGEIIYFYFIQKELYQSQLAEGFEKGDIDNMNRLVTGSDLVINTMPLNVSQFLTTYYSLYN
jgi:hypothetical protein